MDSANKLCFIALCKAPVADCRELPQVSEVVACQVLRGQPCLSREPSKGQCLLGFGL